MGMQSNYATFAPDGTPKPTAPHPRKSVWLGSRLLLSWVSPLMTLGQQRQLNEDDIWTLDPQQQSQVGAPSFQRILAKTHSIPRTFVELFGWRYVGTGLAFMTSTLCALVGPVVLNRVVSSLTSGSFSMDSVLLWVLGLFVSQVVMALAETYANFESEQIAIELAGCLKALLYDKTIKLNALSRSEKSTGDIINMYTSDAEALVSAPYFIHHLWVLPLQILIVSYMLYAVLDVAALAGVAVIALTLVLNNVVTKHMYATYRIYRSSKDARMKKVTEVFKAIGIVKFNAWEGKFLEGIERLRDKELRDMLGFRVYTILTIMIMWATPVFISIASFGAYAVLLQRELTPAVVFTSIALFQMIQGHLRFIPDIVSMLTQSRVALERIEKFLGMAEVNTNTVLSPSDVEGARYAKASLSIVMENASFGWDERTTALKNVDLAIPIGAFCVVHGPVGSGKSSLCSALLGEMVKHSGTVFVGGRIAYCSQQPWIQNLTVRDSILFGLPLDRKKYDEVVDACALTHDLTALEAGDLTEIGERGVNLSGGQKARIALARACYSNADIYVLDSPLSAVDAIVQNEIFNKCLLGLLRDKTVVLVTHSPEIIQSNHVTHSVSVDETGQVVTTCKARERPAYKPVVSPMASCYDKASAFAEVTTEVSSTSTHEQAAMEKGRLIHAEARPEGRVGLHVFEAYYRAIGGFPVVMIVLACQTLWQGLQVSSDFWVGSWSSDSSKTTATMSTASRLGVYCALGLGVALTVMLRTLVITYYGLQAGKRLFDRMTFALTHAPMRFFDANPIGRILSRYSGDVSSVDSSIPFAFAALFAVVFSVGTSMATAAVLIQWKGLLLLPIVYLYVKCAGFFITPAREIQRLTKTAEAPVLNHLSESIEGTAVLRAFGQHQLERFMTSNLVKTDEANKVRYAEMCVAQWFALRIQLLGALLVFVVTSSLVLLHDQLSAAVIGLAFSYALKVSLNLEQITHSLTRIETIMVSPERIQEYIDIPQERAHRIATADPPRHSEWPSRGAITFKNVAFRYKEGDKLVLRDINFSVEGGQKIGIVGRTGAGKSSLTMALFRINELASGSISIDGVDTSKIGLATLRENLSIIPQNPVLFKGSLRGYLDPFGEFEDGKLWSAIRRVGLYDRIHAEDKKLECDVEESGENFSVGERQMLCMARALMRKSRIVILDEATAAMDHETDQKLQRAVREAFAESTVLTIAHRLDTVLDADRILVLEGGEVVEFASPVQLVKKGSGHFFDLMEEGGYLDKFHRVRDAHAA